VAKSSSVKYQPGTIGRFAAMASAYFLGTFNDNFYKQAVLLIAVASNKTEMQGYALAVFTIPFLLFAAPAGWLADRFAKRRVVIAAKWMELAAMISGAIGLCTGHWILIFVMLAIMGTQAAIFSPALNGSIPELFPKEAVTRANGILRMVVTTAILSGIGLSGIALDFPGTGFLGFENGRILVSSVVIITALIGVAVSYHVFSRPAASPNLKFPWSGPINTIKVLLNTRSDKLLAITIAADVFIWFAGSLQILLINPLGIDQFKFSKTMTSLLIVGQLMGIGAGGLLSSFFAKGKRWYRVIIPAGFMMALIMLLIPLVPYIPESIRVPALFLLVASVGVFGGLFMIPLESFIQIRPSAKQKGTIWASANFIIFAGIMISGPIANLINAHLAPTNGFGLLGILSLCVSTIIAINLRRGDLS
jgi:MFS family permease